jgi:hypothetical protein
MTPQQTEQYKDRYLELVQQIDSLDMLQWSHSELEGQIARLNVEKAQAISDGDLVQVVAGPAAGVNGTVVGRSTDDDGVLLVELDGVDMGMPVPIPALALSVLAA